MYWGGGVLTSLLFLAEWTIDVLYFETKYPTQERRGGYRISESCGGVLGNC